MKDILNRLINHECISSEEARQVLVDLSRGCYNQSQIASFLTVYMMRSITVEELVGFQKALLDLCIAVDFTSYETIDLCGTGGDGKNTFNISTLASFVTAGAGVKVSKHGNYGVSSACGSSNVLEDLGLRFSNDADFLKRCIEDCDIAFLHAPLFHPAMKQVAAIRQELGMKTFFNMLGPVVNPSFPVCQMVGVYNLELLRLYAYLYQRTKNRYAIVHALDGYDEISLTGDVKIITNDCETVFTPKDLGLDFVEQSAISGGDSIAGASKIFIDILNGCGSDAQNAVVCANAGLAIATVRKITHREGYALACESLHSGRAFGVLKKLIEIGSAL